MCEENDDSFAKKICGLFDSMIKARPVPVEVVFNPPHTIINWSDGDKTIVKVREGEKFDEHVGFLACVAKKYFGGHNAYKKLIENAVRQNKVK